MLKSLIYRLLSVLLPRRLLVQISSIKRLTNFRDWLFDREKIIKPFRFIQWNGFGFYLHAPLQVLKRASNGGIESSLTKSILKIINKNSNIIDIGANYGFITIVCSIYVKDKGVVYSFECDSMIKENLKYSIKKNNLNNIKLYNVFLSDKNHENSKTVDSLLQEDSKQIDLIKIDTDGTDLQCLKGCSKLVEKFEPVIIIEINNNLDLIMDYVRHKGYKYFYNQYFKKIDKMSDPINIPNLICSKIPIKL